MTDFISPRYNMREVPIASTSRIVEVPSSPRAPSVTTISDSSSSANSRSTAYTSPFLNNQLPIPPESSSKHPPTQMDTAGASTSNRQPYYPLPREEYMSFQAPFTDPATPALSQSPIPIPNPVTMPIPMLVPEPEPSAVPIDAHDSGVDFGPGVRPLSRSPSPSNPLPEPPEEPPLFRSRSEMGFAKTQSRLGFFRPRPVSVATVPSESESELRLTSHFHTYDESARALVEDLRPTMESCIEIIVRLIPNPHASTTNRLIRIELGREEEVCASMEATLRHLWSCITLRPGCACPNEEEQGELPEGERGSDICREFHEAFERKLHRFATRMKTFHEQINKPNRIYNNKFTARLLGWQDSFDQWINRFERLNAYLRLRLAHAQAKHLYLQLEHEQAVSAELRSSENSDSGSDHHLHRTLAVEQLKDEYNVAKSALLEAHKRAAGLAWRRDSMGQLVRDFGARALREEV